MSQHFHSAIRRYASFVVALVYAGVFASCSNDDGGGVTKPKPLSQPAITGVNSAPPGGSTTLCVETPDSHRALEYQIDYDADGEGDLTAWSPEACHTRGWAYLGRYTVRARVREGSMVSAWSGEWTITIIDETVSAPGSIVSDDVVVVGDTLRFCAGGAVSSLKHPVEYRFRIDPADVMDWHISKCDERRWLTPGTFRLRAQARCVFHDGIVSQWSLFFPFSAVSAADTWIVRVLGGPSLELNGATEIDFDDAMPDTLPLGSWVTIVVEGSSPAYEFGSCDQPVNRCIGFQVQYESRRETIYNSDFSSPWFPAEAFDSNPAGVRDTVRLNIGSIEYAIRMRAVDEFGEDPTPVSLPIIGNFAPTLDSSYIENHDGTVVSDMDTLQWDWWAPQNTDTVDAAAGERKKQFSFLIKASGYDDRRDPDGSAIRAWRYFFYDIETATIFYPFARAGEWVETLQPNTLCDTVTWTVRYPMDDIRGDTVFNDLPEWMNVSVAYAVRGRDSALSDRFEQVVRVNGESEVVMEYGTWDFGRRTEAGLQRFFIVLSR